MKDDNVLGMIMAGGKGERLYPLTLERSKPSVPFGGKYRIIDFVMSNFINSGIFSIYVLVQYKSQSLIEHIRGGWKRQGMLSRHFITVVPPQMRMDNVHDWYRGTADAIYQNINLIRDAMPDYVAVFGADHIYRMNIKEMLTFHKKNNAGVTISCIPASIKEASAFGIVEADKSMRVTGFTEKPLSPKSIPYDKDSSFVSMGNYIFNADVLIRALEEDALLDESSHDFGKDIIPRLLNKEAVYAYDFNKNRLPGLMAKEEKAYWRDVGTIESFYNAHMDLLGTKPKLEFSNRRWPIYSASIECPSTRINSADISNSLVGEGCVIGNAKITDSILGSNVVIEDGVVLNGAIIMDNTVVKKQCQIKRTIIDRFNLIKPKTQIGFDRTADSKKYFVSDSGIVIIKRGPRQALY